MIDQDEEIYQANIEVEIKSLLGKLYALLLQWDGEQAEEWIGYVAQWQEEIDNL